MPHELARRLTMHHSSDRMRDCACAMPRLLDGGAFDVPDADQRYEKWKDIAMLSGPLGLRAIRGFRGRGNAAYVTRCAVGLNE